MMRPDAAGPDPISADAASVGWLLAQFGCFMACIMRCMRDVAIMLLGFCFVYNLVLYIFEKLV